MPSRIKARQKGVKGYISAMRPGWLGNPYSLTDIPDIFQNLDAFEEYLNQKLARDPKFKKRFMEIPAKATIGCTCDEDAMCHVDRIIKVWHEIHNCPICKDGLEKNRIYNWNVLCIEHRKLLREDWKKRSDGKVTATISTGTLLDFFD